MPLVPGTRFGPYEIVAPIGAGGMGEVYRARDGRLGRDVAVKVLPAELAADGDRVQRFEQEARAAGILNHANVLAIYDVGREREVSFVVSELLQGETLRERLREGPLSLARAVDVAAQVARGLAAAHEKGVVHRDLKPENLFLTQDGTVKILDFGLARLQQPFGAADGATASLSPATEPGTVMGTVGYMAPEQARGQTVDHRADIFAFGTILLEMISGRRAFARESVVETLSAIIKEEPTGLDAIPPPLDRVLRHCLEKRPEERFQSTRDLVFQIENLRTPSGFASGPPPGAAEPVRRRRRAAWALGPVVAVAAVLAAFAIGQRSRVPAHEAAYTRLTFRRGVIWSARFLPDGQNVVYAAAWDGAPCDVFSARTDGPEARSLGLGAGTSLAAVSSRGEAAVLLDARLSTVTGWTMVGTLARVPVTGGAPREVLEHVHFADWSPDGTELAAVREQAGRFLLEYPIGTVLRETTGWISQPRVSPDGNAVAYLEHPRLFDDAGTLMLWVRGSAPRALGAAWRSASGLAWSPSGQRLWVSGLRESSQGLLASVGRSGDERVVLRLPDHLRVRDVSAQGRVLLERDQNRAGIVGTAPGATTPRDLSWLDGSIVRDVSGDGRRILFSEINNGEETYVRGTDGSPPVRLGDGLGAALSPDGDWAAAFVGTPPRLTLLPTRAGQARTLSHPALAQYFSARWTPDGRRLLFLAQRAGEPPRVYRQDLAEGSVVPITGAVDAPSYDPLAISPEGTRVAIRSGGRLFIHPVDGGTALLAPGQQPGDVPVAWSADGRWIYVVSGDGFPVHVARIDLGTGRREDRRDLTPPDPAGLVLRASFVMTADERAYFYSYYRILSDLLVVDGVDV